MDRNKLQQLDSQRQAGEKNVAANQAKVDELQAKLKDADDTRFVALAFETVLGTSPSKDELAVCVEALAELRGALKDVKEPEQTKRARLQVVQALINHNDFVALR